MISKNKTNPSCYKLIIKLLRFENVKIIYFNMFYSIFRVFRVVNSGCGLN